jgi:hypothetical protein
MKTLITILAFALMSCAETAVQEYDSLLGTWKLSGEIKGAFVVSDIGGKQVVTSGHYEVKGIRYEILIDREIQDNPDFQITIFLLQDKQNGLNIRYCDYNEAFTEITPSQVDCGFNHR